MSPAWQYAPLITNRSTIFDSQCKKYYFSAKFNLCQMESLKITEKNRKSAILLVSELSIHFSVSSIHTVAAETSLRLVIDRMSMWFKNLCRFNCWNRVYLEQEFLDIKINNRKCWLKYMSLLVFQQINVKRLQLKKKTLFCDCLWNAPDENNSWFMFVSFVSLWLNRS